jgi:DNA ligase-1
MPSPTKKRKLNNGTKSTTPARGLEYFFSKQKQDDPDSVKNPKLEGRDGASSDITTELTDEELARKLQAEWDQEVANTPQATVQAQTLQLPSKSNESVSRDESPSPAGPKPTAPITLPTLSKPGPITKTKPTLGLQAAGMAEDTTTTSIPFDESPLIFDPSEYVDQLKGHWVSEGGNASYALLTRCFILINGTTSRIKIVDTLVNCLRVIIEGDPTSLLPAVRITCFFFLFLFLLRSTYLTLIGLACNECHFTTLHLYGIGIGRISNIESVAKCVWTR